MRRRLATLAVAGSVVLAGCAVGAPQPTTEVTDVDAVLNGDIHSNVAGDTEYWWRYGTTTGYGSETPHRTIAIADDQAHPVSEPVAGLTADTTYHFQLCAQDEEEDPPRANCSADGTFHTDPSPDGSLIAFASDRDDSNDDIFVMDSNGNHAENLTDTASSVEATPAWSPDRTKIAYYRDGQIWVMDADGSDQGTITAGPDDRDPAWSPDGAQIAFTRCGEFCTIWVMDADGTSQAPLTSHVGTDIVDSQPTWSPDGDQIAFYSDRDSTDELGIDDIWVMNADGTGETNLTNTLDSAEGEASPAWSPDGDKIAYSAFRDNWEIFVMDADGTDQTNLTDNEGFDVDPAWSSDGSRIAFSTIREEFADTAEIYAMDADGSDPTNLTEHLANDTAPSWSTLP